VLCHAAPVRRLHGLCLGPLSPRGRGSVARPARAASWAFWRGRPAGNRDCVLVCAVATITLWGNCVGAPVETPGGPDSAQHGFSSRLAAQFLVRVWTDRTRLRPEELVIYASRSAFAARRGGRHQLSPTIPRSPGIIPVALSATISDHRAARSQVHGAFRPVHRRSYPRGSGCYCADQNASAIPGGTTPPEGSTRRTSGARNGITAAGRERT
jgi:hypothetical protein